MKQYVTNDSITGKDIRELRERLSMTQKDFAVFLRCSKRTVENWESKDDNKIKGPIVLVFELLMRKPELTEKLELPPKKYNIRLIYRKENLICTVIDVNEQKRIVEIRNYVDNPLYRAFGVNTEPTYEDYEEFLRSRVFPDTRDKMKLELKRLGLPFYDPIMIIEKTNGKMADDDFSLTIER